MQCTLDRHPWCQLTEFWASNQKKLYMCVTNQPYRLMANAYVLSKKMYGECTHTYIYIYISNRIDCHCTYVQKHIDDLDYMYMTFMMDYMETCPGHVATVQHHAPAVPAFCHFNVLPRVAANLFMEWRYD